MFSSRILTWLKKSPCLCLPLLRYTFPRQLLIIFSPSALIVYKITCIAATCLSIVSITHSDHYIHCTAKSIYVHVTVVKERKFVSQPGFAFIRKCAKYCLGLHSAIPSLFSHGMSPTPLAIERHGYGRGKHFGFHCHLPLSGGAHSHWYHGADL